MSPMSLAPPRPCNWNRIDAQAARVARIGWWPRRNRVITRLYASIYLKDNDLIWPGIAAFASKQIGWGIRWSWITVVGLFLPLVLAYGNTLVFKDIFPLLLFARVYGRTHLWHCIQNRPQLLPSLGAACSELSKDRFESAASRMLWHEQFHVLQTKVFDGWYFRCVSWITRLALTCCQCARSQQCLIWCGRGVSFSSQTAIDNPLFGVVLRPRRGLINDFNVRWHFAKRVLRKFIRRRRNVAHHNFIRQQLKILSTH